MCSDPIEHDGNTFACRRCDECIATRRHGWVARAMAEKATSGHAICLTLTYSDDTEESRQGAAMFAYRDVRLFLQRLRSAARYEADKPENRWNITPYARFLCAGEQGDRNGRCHWHLILFTNFDVCSLGEYRLRGEVVSNRGDMITEGKRKRRLNWNLWPHGYITIQEPDQAGMNYVLSYCLKDQFTYEKSKGTMREAKSENFATGLFRMSKRPAIGHEFLIGKMESLLEKNSVLPSLQVRVPGFKGYWHPSGSFREKLLWWLVALNQRIVWTTGAPAPQWSALLASCAENENDMEILNGPKEEVADYKEVARKVGRRADAIAEWRLERASLGPCRCRQCLGSYSFEQLAEIGVVAVAVPGGRTVYLPEGAPVWADEIRVWTSCVHHDGP